MIIKYTNTKQDYLEYHMFLYEFSGKKKQDAKESRKMYFIFAALLGLFAIINLITYLKDKTNTNGLSSAISYLLVTIITLSFAFISGLFRNSIEKMTYKRALKKSTKIVKETVIDLNEKGLSFSGEVEGFVKATEQKQLKETTNLYIIVLRKVSLAVPKQEVKDVELFKKLLHAQEI